MADRPSAGETTKRAKEEEPVVEKGARNGNGRSVPPPPASSTPARRSVPPPPEKAAEEAVHPSIPPLPAAGPWRSYKEIVAGLATRIVDGQRPIRVLQAVRWDNSIEEQFRRSRFRELPKVDIEYYTKQELGFDPK